MNKFGIEGGYFSLNGRKVFLNSGEIHYFRIKRELWEEHLKKAKEAGLKTISSYVPWVWHEVNEGEFDFSGTTQPERDLIGWIELCQKHGFTCIVKPGPFILAEYRGAGLPDWFLERYGDTIKMHNSKGEAVLSDGVSLFSPAFLSKVEQWYNHVMPVICQKQIQNGGPIIMVQVCNEIGVFSWLAHQADYNEQVKEQFISFIKTRYSTIDELNTLWETNYTSFQEIELPPDGNTPYKSKGDRSRDYEWHCFWRKYYANYLRLLSSWIRKHNISIPLYHNLPGWIYGHGYEFPLNITMYEDLYKDKSELIFGVDHIPEFVSYRNLHDDRIINDIVSAMQGEKPLFAAEFQSGSREYHVVTNPREMELFYKASIANGLKGWNYYMFSQGKNPPAKGYSGDTFYWFTPLDNQAKPSSAFPVVQKMSRFIETHEELILTTKRKAEVCVLFYSPYYATELERPEVGASELKFVPARIRRSAYFDGLLKALQVLNVDYDMVDLASSSVNDLLAYKQVWLFSTDEMNAPDQQTIASFVTNGGNLVIFPYLPDREMNQKPCTVLRDTFKIKSSKPEIIDSPLIKLYNLTDIKCSNPLIAYTTEAIDGATPIAFTLRGSICGFEKNVGKGKVVHLGTWLGFDTEGHLQAYTTILERSKAQLANASSTNNFITVRQKFNDTSESLLFVGNYYNENQSGKITYKHPNTNERVQLPLIDGEIEIPPLYAFISPISKEIGKGINILHTTSDVIGINSNKNIITIHLTGDPGLIGEMVLEGINITKIKSAEISEKPIMLIWHNNRIVLNYLHSNKEILLTLKMLDK